MPSPTIFPNKLHINNPESVSKIFAHYGPVIIDVETDEKDGFVGMAMTKNGVDIAYITDLTNTSIKYYLEHTRIVGHNVKFDCRFLAKHGIFIASRQIQDDTMILSYSLNPTKESHGLKDLGKELGYEWPTYQEMTGTGRNRVTLDKLPVEDVALYCGTDCFVTYALYSHLYSAIKGNNKKFYQEVEMPVYRLLYDMEQDGIRVDTERLKELDKEFSGSLVSLQDRIYKESGCSLNLNSPKQVVGTLFSKLGIKETSSNKAVLNKYSANSPVICDLLKYRELQKLQSSFTSGLLAVARDGRVYPTYNQVSYDEQEDAWRGIRTGRLSASDPNPQQIPARTDNGKKIRECFIADENSFLFGCDYSQIEYRLLADMSQEPVILKAFHEGKDVHEETARILGVDRFMGKTLNFAAIYGAQPKKIAATARISEVQAEAFLASYWKALPKVQNWINSTKYKAHAYGGITTLGGRFIPLPGLQSSNRYERRHWERASVNYTIQGSAADIIKKSMIKCSEEGYRPILSVHDELLFNFFMDDEKASKGMKRIQEIMETIMKLSVPLVVDTGTGENWREAKGD